MTGQEIGMLGAVIESGFVNEGPRTAEFETRVAKFVGCTHAMATNSGTVGMSLALMACNIGPGDEVIMPGFTYVATANAITLTGAKPIFCDINPSDYLISSQQVEALITPRTKAVLAVDVNGRISASTELQECCRNAGLSLIFDSAEGLGSALSGQMAGTFGDVSVFSLSPNKVITAGQGGVVTTDNDSIFSRLRQLKLQGLNQRGTGGDDNHDALGFNFKFTDLQAAVALAQFDNLDARLETMRTRNAHYHNRLSQIKDVSLASYLPQSGTLLWPDILCTRRDELRDFLQSKGIQSRAFWKPVADHAPYQHNSTGESLPVSRRVSANGLWLPAALDLSEDAIDHVCDTIEAFFT